MQQQQQQSTDRSTISKRKSFKRQDVPFAEYVFVFSLSLELKAKQEILYI
jgi:hypothetical protein